MAKSESNIAKGSSMEELVPKKGGVLVIKCKSAM